MKNQFMMAVAVCITLLLPACERAKCRLNDSRLTPETQIGANTMSCLIDGQVWVANGISGYGDRADNCKFYVHTNWAGKNKPPVLQIMAKTQHSSARKNGIVVLILDTSSYEIKGNANVKRYKLLVSDTTKGNLANCAGYTDPGNYPSHYGHVYGVAQGWVELSRNDTLAGVLSGRFEFYAENTDGKGIVPLGSKVHITQGRFHYT
ncbi:hypothetical protein QT971_30465 [Microcoleus sp. herbarium19]|uniref:hypothetical protein n=1 Tax=Microcoleus sp. herbarium19 TaxID=3055440 RepID=UPI002FD5B94A